MAVTYYYNKRLKERVVKESSLGHYNSMNVLSMHALMGAYTPEGREWVGELCEVLGENVRYACDYIDEHLQEFLCQGTVLICFL